MAQFAGKVSMVAGGTGSIGKEIVRVLLKEGSVVLVPVCSEAGARKLSAHVSDIAEDRLITIQADFDGEAGINALLDTVKWRYPELELIVAAMGSGWQGPSLTAMKPEDWKALLHRNLTAHLLFARAFWTHLQGQPQGMYVELNHSGAEQPLPGSGALSVVDAARKMMVQVLAAENENANVRIFSLMLPFPPPPPGQPEPENAEEQGTKSGELIVNLYTGTAPNPEKLFHYLK